ncbi:RDD family protein [Cellulophaga sp. Hel_I_12]|uniref:RDD family protein n=1 Tax=Cellulophaga sp. Hel_I_12 TaxID=1249972 RepID=UPI000646E26C|nr:RDD family protein [Cellulophaga sp. Hel_I_12]
MEQIQTQPNIGKRVLAGFIDYFIIYAVTFFLAYTLGEPNDEGGYSLNGAPALIPMIFWLFMTVGLEQLFGATFGNGLVGLKPISILEHIDGRIYKNAIQKSTFGQSFKRHLLDLIDMFFFGLVAIITIKNSEKNQRLGDLWAKTTVIKIEDEK